MYYVLNYVFNYVFPRRRRVCALFSEKLFFSFGTASQRAQGWVVAGAVSPLCGAFCASPALTGCRRAQHSAHGARPPRPRVALISMRGHRRHTAGGARAWGRLGVRLATGRHSIAINCRSGHFNRTRTPVSILASRFQPFLAFSRRRARWYRSKHISEPV